MVHCFEVIFASYKGRPYYCEIPRLYIVDVPVCKLYV